MLSLIPIKVFQTHRNCTVSKMSTQEEPTIEEHRDWAFHNKEFANKLTCEEFENYQDWRVVALFYTAIHFIEAYLGKEWEEEEDFEIDDHKKRANLMFWSEDLRPFYKKYQHLSDDSWNARYQCVDFTKREVDELRRNKFRPIVSYITDNL